LGAPVITYTSPEEIHWVIDTNQTVVINQHNGNYAVLSGLEGVIWSWLTLNYSYDTLLNLTNGLDQPNAEQLLHTTLQKWVRAGLLIKRNG
jgi:hypothetical protein